MNTLPAIFDESIDDVHSGLNLDHFKLPFYVSAKPKPELTISHVPVTWQDVISQGSVSNS